MNPLRIAVAGAGGQMGRMLIDAVLGAADMQLGGAFDMPGTPVIGRDAGESSGRKTGVVVADSVTAAIAQADCLIDFTRPEGTLAHLAVAQARGVRMVIGTTGFDEHGVAAIRAAASKTAIVFAPNMSVGLNATLKVLELAARILSDGYDVEIYEMHHRRKVDAPSGTALRMGDVVAEATGRKLADCIDGERRGHTGPRQTGRIGFAVSRGGDVIGDHTVTFAGIGERVEITHRSSSRETYAQGSLRAARFLAGRTRGLFDMQDVLGLRT